MSRRPFRTAISDPKANEFVRHNGHYTLSILAPEDVGQPYGRYPRLVLADLNTEAVKRKTRHIELDHHFSHCFAALGIPPTTGSRGSPMLREQMQGLFASTFRFALSLYWPNMGWFSGNCLTSHLLASALHHLSKCAHQRVAQKSRETFMTKLKLFVLVAIFALVAGIGYVAPAVASDEPTLEALLAEQKVEDANLANFDDLDFRVFTGQRWADFHKSHAEDIKVHWPDGHTTEGLERHIEDLKAMFVYAPDTRILEHPVKIAQGEWTAVIGYMEGTFSQPMPIGDGKTIAPTGKSFRIRMATIGHWTEEGVMDEEYLFWDNQSFMKQIGLAE